MTAYTVPPADDPWAWLHEDQDSEIVDVSDLDVVGVLYSLGGRHEAQRLVDAVNAGTVRPRMLVAPDSIPEDADWIWVLTDQCEPKKEALSTLLACLKADPDVDIVGALTVERRRRGTGSLIRDFGQTISRTGRLRTFAETGERYQGQLSRKRVLGAPAAGLLVRGQIWRALGGLIASLSPELWGVEFCWRANLSGAKVVVDPAAEVIDHLRSDAANERAGGLRLVAAHTNRGWRPLTSLRLVLMTLLAALGFVLSKNPTRAHTELVGLFGWLRESEPRRDLQSAIQALKVTQAGVGVTKKLRLGFLAGLRRAVEVVAARFSDWISTFTTQQTSTVSLDDLTSDEYNRQEGRIITRVPVALTGIVITVILAFVAARQTLRSGWLRAPEQFAAPSSAAAMVSDYLTPVAGGGLSSPPWQGLVGLLSFVSAGNPDLLVTILVIGCVPLAWLAAYRLCRQLVSGSLISAVAASAYALAPVLSGAINQTGFAAALWTVLLAIAAYSVWWWQSGPGLGTWRGAAAVAIWLLFATALLPLVWPVAVGIAIWRIVQDRLWVSTAQWGMIIAAPALLILGPWRDTLLTYPGRIFIGIEPSLRSMDDIPTWRIPFASLIEGSATPPMWISITVVSVVWITALAGAVRRSRARAFLCAGAVLTLCAIGQTRLLVWVPPGVWVRPSGAELMIVAIGMLALAGLVGLAGIGKALRGRSIGLRHGGALGLAMVSIAALIIGGSWWAWDGESSLTRQSASALPKYVLDVQRSATPGRTLAIVITQGKVSWSLLDGESPRLGQIERGLAFGADADASQLAESVVGRLVAGSADDLVTVDLQTLGVANIWLSGGDSIIRLGIENTPGLRTGTGQDDWMVWVVPDSAIAVIQTPLVRERTGNGEFVVDGESNRVLTLAEPEDSRWVATLDGRPLSPSTADGVGQRFNAGAQGGVLEYHLAAGSLWWAWAQAVGLVLLIVLAFPGARIRANTSGPRRAAGADE